jgi:predicted CopG family antitoxin
VLEDLINVNKLKHITVSEENYKLLRSLGCTSDSFNDVITALLNKTPEGEKRTVVTIP